MEKGQKIKNKKGPKKRKEISVFPFLPHLYLRHRDTQTHRATKKKIYITKNTQKKKGSMCVSLFFHPWIYDSATERDKDNEKE